jgi:hypothetical protein
MNVSDRNQLPGAKHESDAATERKKIPQPIRRPGRLTSECQAMLAGMLKSLRPVWLGPMKSDSVKTDSVKPESVKNESVLEKEVETVTVMNEQIKKAIRTRARKARSNEEVADAIFGTLRDYRIDVKHVSLDEMKAAVVEATRASRENEHGSRPV